MPWTPAQRRLFFAQAARGEISEAEARRRAREGTRTDVTRSGHARKKKRVKKRAGTKRHALVRRKTRASRRPVKRSRRRSSRRR